MISDKLKFILCASLALVVLQCVQHKAFAQTSSRMYGDVGLTTNYVDRGLTQSKKSPSINAGAGYWFGNNGRIGFEGASVAFENESTSVEMRLFSDYKIPFSQTSEFKIRVDWVRYFSEDLRNKVMATLDQSFMNYHFLVSREDNFEGTKKPRNWFGIHKDWPYSQAIVFNTTLGYSMVEDFDSYFDTRVAASYIMNTITVALVNTYVSSAAQFNGHADMAFFLTLQAKF